MTLAPKCDCGHGLVRHPTRGFCTRCACTWYHPNVRAVRRRPRPAAETVRTHGTAERRAWMKTLPCLICGRTPCDAAHLTNGGVGRKDDASRSVPLCSDTIGYSGHHSEYDGGKLSFRAKYAVDLEAEAARVDALWQQQEAA